MLQPTDNTIAFASEVVSELELRVPNIWDQAFVNEILPRRIRNGLKFEFFDPYYVNNILGLRALERNTASTRQLDMNKVALLHCGAMIGPNEKIAGLRQMNAWLVNFWYY